MWLILHQNYFRSFTLLPVSSNPTMCHSCVKRSTKQHIRRSVGDVITEIDILTTHEDVTFESFLAQNANQIQQLVKEYVSNSGVVLFNLTFDELLHFDCRLLLSMSVCHATQLSDWRVQITLSSCLVLNILCCCSCFCRSIRVHTRADAVLRRERENGDIMYVPAFFGTRPEDENKSAR